jgi:mRNA-degrading endonuclease RelE of RelBE toxin-antitoxin system
VRRFCIVYAVKQKTRVIRLMAVGHRRHVDEELAERLRRTGRE